MMRKPKARAVVLAWQIEHATLLGKGHLGPIAEVFRRFAHSTGEFYYEANIFGTEQNDFKSHGLHWYKTFEECAAAVERAVAQTKVKRDDKR